MHYILIYTFVLMKVAKMHYTTLHASMRIKICWNCVFESQSVKFCITLDIMFSLMTLILPRLKWRKLLKNKFRFAPRNPFHHSKKKETTVLLELGRRSRHVTDVNLTCPLLVRPIEYKELKLGEGSLIYSVY